MHSQGELPLDFIIISVSCAVHYMKPFCLAFPPTLVRGGKPSGLIHPLQLPPSAENYSVTAASFSGKPSFH